MPDTHNLYRRGEGGVWYLVYRGVRRSLQTDHLPTARKRRKAEIAKIDAARWGEERYPWHAAVGRWLAEEAASSRGKATVTRYLLSLRMVEPVLGHLHLDEINRKALAQVAHRKGVTNATRRRDLTAVSAVLRSAASWGWIEHNPARDFDRGAIRERREPIILPKSAEVERFASNAPGATLPWLVRLLRHTGMRLEEAASLQWHQIDMQQRTIKLEKTKGNRVRVVPLSEFALSTIRSTPRLLGCPWVFWHSDCDRYHKLDSYLMKVRKSLGLRWRTHDLRHLFAVEYLMAGGSLYQLQRILGHVTIRTTEMYLDHLSPEEADRAKGVG